MTNKIDYDIVHKDLIEKIQNIDTKSDLRFRRIESCDKNEIKVSYFGHQVGGSYVHAHQVAPKYVEDIEYTTNRSTKYDTYSCGGFGFDFYFFTIYTNKILVENKYEPKGELLRVENNSFAFEYDGGKLWSLLYIFVRELNAPNNILNKFNIKIQDNILYIDDIEISYIVKYIPQSHYTRNGGGVSISRTIFNAIFDVFIEEKKLTKLLYDKYKEIVNYYFKDECVNVYIETNFETGDRLIIENKNKFKYKIGPNWYVLNDENSKKILESYKQYVFNLRLITLPSGTEVEIINESEMNEKLHGRNNSFGRFGGGYGRYNDIHGVDFIVGLMLKYKNIRDLTKEEINFLSFKLYRYYPNIYEVQSLVL